MSNHPNRAPQNNNDDRGEDSRKLWPFFFIIPILGFSFLPITGSTPQTFSLGTTYMLVGAFTFVRANIFNMPAGVTLSICYAAGLTTDTFTNDMMFQLDDFTNGQHLIINQDLVTTPTAGNSASCASPITSYRPSNGLAWTLEIGFNQGGAGTGQRANGFFIATLG